jgi:hypothetical protein
MLKANEDPSEQKANALSSIILRNYLSGVLVYPARVALVPLTRARAAGAAPKIVIMNIGAVDLCSCNRSVTDLFLVWQGTPHVLRSCV